MSAGEIEVGLAAGPSIEIVNPDELEDAIAGIPAEELPQALPILPLRDMVAYPGTLTPLAVGQERSIRLIDDVLSGDRMLALVASREPDIDEPMPRAAARCRRCRRRRPDAQGPRRHDPDPGRGRAADLDRLLRRHRAVSDRQYRGARGRGRGGPRARSPDPQRPAHVQRDHRADPLPAGGAAARRHQPRRPVSARPSDRRLAADPDRRRSRSCSRRWTSTPVCAASPRSSPASSR